MILVDATNAFNQLNRQVTLLNCDKICPAMAHILINTYRNNSCLFVDGQCLLSEEETTQGDPFAMAVYAIGTLPLIHKLDGIAKQTWYTDDSAAASSLEQLRRWWDTLSEIGPLYILPLSSAQLLDEGGSAHCTYLLGIVFLPLISSSLCPQTPP